MSKDNGGPAFPQPQLMTGGRSGIVSSAEMGEGGMTLRDYFAAKAMLMSGFTPEHRAKLAYELADAMLLERAKCQT